MTFFYHPRLFCFCKCINLVISARLFTHLFVFLYYKRHYECPQIKRRAVIEKYFHIRFGYVIRVPCIYRLGFFHDDSLFYLMCIPLLFYSSFHLFSCTDCEYRYDFSTRREILSREVFVLWNWYEPRCLNSFCYHCFFLSFFFFLSFSLSLYFNEICSVFAIPLRRRVARMDSVMNSDAQRVQM